jgi:hypothetical protein
MAPQSKREPNPLPVPGRIMLDCGAILGKRGAGNEEFVYQAVLCGELEIDEAGRIWRLKTKRFSRSVGATIAVACQRVRAELDSGEYLQVRVMFAGCRRYALAHRLVWLHFNGFIPRHLTVDHKNELKKDNRPENLVLSSDRDQQLRTVRSFRRSRERGLGLQTNKKLTAFDVAQIKFRRAEGETFAKISSDYPVSPRTIVKIDRGEIWAHIGPARARMERAKTPTKVAPKRRG